LGETKSIDDSRVSPVSEVASAVLCSLKWLPELVQRLAQKAGVDDDSHDVAPDKHDGDANYEFHRLAGFREDAVVK
jgi:hypothetical protein